MYTDRIIYVLCCFHVKTCFCFEIVESEGRAKPPRPLTPYPLDTNLVYMCTVAYLGFHFGGGFIIFLEKWGYLHGEAMRLVGGSGACSTEKIFKNGAIWCVLESILLKFCQKSN